MNPGLAGGGGGLVGKIGKKFRIGQFYPSYLIVTTGPPPSGRGLQGSPPISIFKKKKWPNSMGGRRGWNAYTLLAGMTDDLKKGRGPRADLRERK